MNYVVIRHRPGDPGDARISRAFSDRREGEKAAQKWRDEGYEVVIVRPQESRQAGQTGEGAVSRKRQTG